MLPCRVAQTEEEAGATTELHRHEEMTEDENRQSEKVGETLTDTEKDTPAAAVGTGREDDDKEDKTAQRRE